MTIPAGAIRRIKAGSLSIAYLEYGSASGWPCILGHGFPYDAHAYDQAASVLARTGARVIVPICVATDQHGFCRLKRRARASRRLSASTFSTSWTRSRSSAPCLVVMIGRRASASSQRCGPSGSSRLSPAILTTSKTLRRRWSRRARPRRRRSGISTTSTASGDGAAWRRTGRRSAPLMAQVVAEVGVRRCDLRSNRERLRQSRLRRCGHSLLSASLRARAKRRQFALR